LLTDPLNPGHGEIVDKENREAGVVLDLDGLTVVAGVEGADREPGELAAWVVEEPKRGDKKGFST
jgi:hypothetical protein